MLPKQNDPPSFEYVEKSVFNLTIFSLSSFSQAEQCHGNEESEKQLVPSRNLICGLYWEISFSKCQRHNDSEAKDSYNSEQNPQCNQGRCKAFILTAMIDSQLLRGATRIKSSESDLFCSSGLHNKWTRERILPKRKGRLLHADLPCTTLICKQGQQSNRDVWQSTLYWCLRMALC